MSKNGIAVGSGGLYDESSGKRGHHQTARVHRQTANTTNKNTLP